MSKLQKSQSVAPQFQGFEQPSSNYGSPGLAGVDTRFSGVRPTTD